MHFCEALKLLENSGQIWQIVLTKNLLFFFPEKIEMVHFGHFETKHLDFPFEAMFHLETQLIKKKQKGRFKAPENDPK